ncbi:phage tail protein [Roseibium suaedae]|uniref:Microcystin-dependent protein n=1 Tax=Roseibium suaedae TaxID=735517 RepID=A0A1M7KGR2_9HYPH|nr:tail fiber protein [Roseibium suaedae]SHM64505.1 Microcystin-dependent protein [Roseibium suaedae]
MSEPFVGEIRMFAGNFAPRSWAFCDGQLLAVSQNDALFSLLGTVYGGDGRTTFGLPDMRGRIPVHQGTGPGLSPRRLGSKSGSEYVTLTVNQLPSHTHTLNVSSAQAMQTAPTQRMLGEVTGYFLYRDDILDVQLNANTITSFGGSQRHTNMMPSLCVNFIIALFGIYPSRH